MTNVLRPMLSHPDEGVHPLAFSIDETLERRRGDSAGEMRSASMWEPSTARAAQSSGAGGDAGAAAHRGGATGGPHCLIQNVTQRRWLPQMKWHRKFGGSHVGGGLSKMAKRELLATIRVRYRSSSKKDKRCILDEFILVTPQSGRSCWIDCELPMTSSGDTPTV